MFASKEGSRASIAKVGDGKVAMVFKHALSQIEVRVKTDEDYHNDLQFDINSVRFNNIDLSGDVIYANDAISWSDNDTQDQNWDYYTTSKENILNYDLSTDEGKTNALYGAAILMIPQNAFKDNAATSDVIEGTTITIGYSMQQLPKANNEKITGTVTVPAPWTTTADAEIAAWEAGKKYNYTINFKLNEILFNPTVTDWVEVDVKAINILD